MPKDKKEVMFGIRISKEDKEAWFIYALKHGYEYLSEFLRDTINTLILKEKKPTKVFIIKEK